MANNLSKYPGIFFKNHEIKQCCHFLVNKCKIFKMLIKTLFLRLFQPDQSKIKEIIQEIVNIHNGSIFKNGTASFSGKQRLQPLAPLMYADNLQTIDQAIHGLTSLSFFIFFPYCSESSVAFAFL